MEIKKGLTKNCFNVASKCSAKAHPWLLLVQEILKNIRPKKRGYKDFNDCTCIQKRSLNRNKSKQSLHNVCQFCVKLMR